MGYGTPAPKVAETVNRTREFNKKEDSPLFPMFHTATERTHWTTEIIFPFNEISGNWHPGEFARMLRIFLCNNYTLIDNVVNKVMDKIMSQNSDVLTKGRQTWDPITERSVPSSVAYEKMLTFYKENLQIVCSNNLEWIQCFFKYMERDSLKITRIDKKKNRKRKYNSSEKQYIEVEGSKIEIVKDTITGRENVRKYMIDMARSFCSYIKHGERGKKDRRAIASANPILRMFLHIIESFHLELGKSLSGSTISIGGDEKRRKMIAEMGSGTMGLPHEKSLQATQDATKWNECLNPSTFAMMHHYLFDDAIRDKFSLPRISEQGKLYSRIACSGNALMSVKMITLGEGVLVSNDKVYTRIEWKEEFEGSMNSSTKEWFRKIKNHIYNGIYVESPSGMLMGMLNAGSTTLGLIPTMYGIDPGKAKVTTLRSSDDSMSLFVGETSRDLLNAIEVHRRSLKMVGINTSIEKTWFYKKGYGEFTSWYCDEIFLSQYGVETSTLRPQGKNPYDDAHTIAKSTSVGLQQMTINHLGADCKLRVGIDNVRRLYKINVNYEKRAPITGKVLLIADGGTNIWDTSNCHLDEIAQKRFWSRSNEEKEYLLKVLNPNNPFSSDPEEEISYNKDHECLVVTETETPRNVFSFVRKTNRTVRNSLMKGTFDKEKQNAAAIKIARMIDPALYLRIPNIKTPLNKYLAAQMELQRSNISMTEEEALEYEKALFGILHGKEDPKDDDIGGFNLPL